MVYEADNTSIKDAFPDFLKFWEKSGHLDLVQQILAWENDCIRIWPELLQIQIEDYDSQGVDWRKVAAEKVFPFINDRFAEMHIAHDIILVEFAPRCLKAREILNLDQELTGLIHVGIGCGAGWVTPYEGKQTILFGLENIAECHWTTEEDVRGLIAHEIGHVVQAVWRSDAGLKDCEGPWWQLFIEGFAQHCEQLILERESWHMATDSDDDWLAWCQKNRAGLATRFLEDVGQDHDIRPFFGSWYDIEGHPQCGYYLGNEAIQYHISKGMKLQDIALLEDPQTDLMEALHYLISTNQVEPS
jgi:hypothetical protein